MSWAFVKIGADVVGADVCGVRDVVTGDDV